MNNCDECRRLRDALGEVATDRERIRSALRVLIHATEGSSPDPAALAAARQAAKDAIPEWNDLSTFRDGMRNVFNAESQRERKKRS